MRSGWWAAAFALLVLPAVAGASLESPGPPMLVQAEANDAETIVSWLPPLYDGGYPVLNYTVYRQAIGLDEWEIVGQVGPESTFFVAPPDPSGGWAYSVTAINAVGESVHSLPFLPTCEPVGTSSDTTPPFVHVIVNEDCLDP